MRLEIAVAARPHHCEGIAAARGLDLHFLDRLLQRLGVVHGADADARPGAQHSGVEIRNRGGVVDGSNAILLSFLDLEGDEKALLFRIVFGQRRHHLHVGITVLQVEAANQVAVRLDPIRIVDVGAAEEAQQIRFTRLDDVAQAIGRKGDVADEFDRAHAGLGALDDGKDEIDAIVRLLDDLRRDAHVIAAGAAVDFGDSLRVRLHHRAREGAARLGLDFGRELLVLDLLVALKGDAADHRVFHHRDDDLAAPRVDADVLEQAGFDQRLEAVVDLGLAETAAGTRAEIGTDGFDFDAAVPLHRDGGNRLGSGRRRDKRHRQCGGNRHSVHDQGSEQAPPYSHSPIHALCALRHSDAGSHFPQGTSRFPTCCPACSQFCRGGKRSGAAQFHFHSNTLPISNVTKKPLLGARGPSPLIQTDS